MQINPTEVNGVDTSDLGGEATINNVLNIMKNFPTIGFIIQKSDETKPLWEGLLKKTNNNSPSNMSMLSDESKGTGKLISSFSTPPNNYNIGYAGGIGPSTVVDVVNNILLLEEKTSRRVWIDMESSLRSICDGRDIFDINKCVDVIRKICENCDGCGYEM